MIAFSQKDTNNICIPLTTAKKIAKELISFDSLKYGHYYLKSNYDILLKTIDIKDSIISNKDSVILLEKIRYSSLSSISMFKDSQVLAYRTMSDISSKNEKKEIAKNNILKKVLIASFILIIYIFVTK